MPEIGGTAFELKDWVRETTQTVGTGSYQLDGPVTIDDVTYLSFISQVGDGNQTAYVVIRGAQRERGIGTVSSGSPPTLSRDVILGGSSGTSPVNWTGGDPKDIFIDAPSELLNQIGSTPELPDLRTAIATTSGTTHDFTSISADATRLTATFRQVSTNGTAGFGLRLGTAGSFLTTGYTGSITRILSGAISASSIFSDRFSLTGATTASDEYSGHAVITKVSSDIWVMSSLIGADDTAGNSLSAGQINLAAPLTRVRLLSSDTFDGGSFRLLVE